MRKTQQAGQRRALAGLLAAAACMIALSVFSVVAAQKSLAQEDTPGPAKSAPPASAQSEAAIPLPPPRVAREPPPLWSAGEVLPAAPLEGAQDDLGGTVVDAAGASVPGADVRVFASDPVPWQDRFPETPLIFVDLDAVGRAPDHSTKADAQGRFRVAVPGGRTWRIDASEGDRAGGTFVSGGGPRPGANQVVLRPVTTCATVVRNALTGAPVAGAEILAWHVSIEGPPTWVARTDALGRADVRRTGHESYLVLARDRQPVLAEIAPGSAEVRLDLSPWCDGRTTDRGLGPIAGACVWTRGTVRGYPDLALLTRSGADGRFSLPSRGAGGSNASLVAAGPALLTMRNTPVDARLVLEPLASVEGEVVDWNGRPTERWDLAGAERGPGGAFRIRSIRPGTWRLAARIGGSIGMAEATVVVRPGAAVRGVRLVLLPPPPRQVSNVRLRVEAPTEVPLSDLRVRLARGGWSETFEPGRDGSVRVDGLLVPPGTKFTAVVLFVGASCDLPFVSLGSVDVVSRSRPEPDDASRAVVRVVRARKVTLRVTWPDPLGWDSSITVVGAGVRAGVGVTVLEGGLGFEAPLFVASDEPQFTVRIIVSGTSFGRHDAVHRAEEIRDGVLTIPVDRVAIVRCDLSSEDREWSERLCVTFCSEDGLITLVNDRGRAIRKGASERPPTVGLTPLRSLMRVPWGPAVLRVWDGNLLFIERKVEIAEADADLGVVEVRHTVVRVRVVDSLGLAVPRATVHGACARGTTTATTDANGEALLRLPRGVATVVHATNGRAVSRSSVVWEEDRTEPTSSREAPVELRLEAGGWIVLLRDSAPVTTGVSVVARALGEGGDPATQPGPELDLVPDGWSGLRWDDAPFGFDPLPPGRYQLTIREGERVRQRDVEVAAGGLTEVDLSR